MNYHFFAMKRAYHATLRLTRDVAAAYGLTPARSDMLYAIYCVPVHGPAGRGALSQAELRQRLGVSAPTVSRMVRSLETLGFVSRRRSSGDQCEAERSDCRSGRFLGQHLHRRYLE